MNHRSTPESFYAKVNKIEGGCWLWMGATSRLGYGQLGYQGRRTSAHRLSYELNKGAIPEGLLIRHTCDNPNCCNPDHLLVGTHQDNMDDKASRGRQRGPAGTPSINPVFKTVGERELEQYGACPQGHTLTPNNQKVKKNGEVVCTACYYTIDYRRRFNNDPLTEAQIAVIQQAADCILALLNTLPIDERLKASIGIDREAARIMNDELQD